jgi:membrane dipeptidase
MIVDAHLDLAYNALHGRDVLVSALEQKADKDGIPTVGLPDLRAGKVGLICGTIFLAPKAHDPEGYSSPAEAQQQATAQMQWYLQQEMAGRMHLVRQVSDLPTDGDPGTSIRTIVLMEGADPIESADHIDWWYAQGVRIVGMAWKQTRYAGGTGAPGGLTPIGKDLAVALDEVGIIHDISHLAEQAFWQLLEITPRPVIASHSNCRSIVPTDRQLSDDMINAILKRDGVIGINFYDRFLLRPGEREVRRATLVDVMDHVKHICDLAGDADHVGIGTDFDGGLGRENIPQEITTAADLHKLEDAANRAGFSDADTGKLMAGNWLRFFRKNLPQ